MWCVLHILFDLYSLREKAVFVLDLVFSVPINLVFTVFFVDGVALLIDDLTMEQDNYFALNT